MPADVVSVQDRPVYSMLVALYIFAVIAVGVLESAFSLSFLMWPVTLIESFQSM